MIEGATNLGALAGWAKQFGKVTTSALTGSKREMAKKLTEKFAPTIKKYAGVPITKIWALSREPLQEWLQEGTGEFLRAKALPQYLYDPNVKLDGAFGGFWFGAGTQVVGKAMQYKFGDKDSRDFTPEEGYSNVVRNAMEEAIVPWHAEGTVGDKERDIILKAGIIMNPTEGLGFINDLTSDPVERRELKKEAYGLIKKGYAKEGWANPEKATAMLVSNIDLVDRVYPNATVSDLRESGIQFTEEQLSKITGKAYSKPVGDYYNPADAGEDLNAPYPTDQYSGVHQEYNDPNEDMLAMELNQTQQELHILKTQRPDTAENRKKIETYEGVLDH